MVDHGKSTKRKKHHDKDKYYKLAKEQGLRSRAAFKLTQINRQHPILDNRSTKVVLDLCAAPGGWTQIAGRICGSKTKIVAVDILPIRNLNKPNITTIVGDITTEKCKADIARSISPHPADVVLHDGAPNIGASYEKDAYEQLELAVHALKCATQHLKKNGSFVTKIYRSRDSASFQWVVKQLFRDVTVFKPKASRQQSAEIFYVCQGYLKPDKIDPRLLDPKHIFELVEGDTTGGAGQVGDNFNVFHKSWDKQKRHRDGYDTELLDGTMRHIQPVANFVFSKGATESIKLLSTCTSFTFRMDDIKVSEDAEEGEDALRAKQNKFLLNNPLTTPEIKECIIDLKVLNKGDFKGLMLWREKMVQTWEDMYAPKAKAEEGEDSDSSDEEDGSASEDEDGIQKEIQDLRKRKLREKKKIKKKERKLAAKRRRQAALGMDLNAIEVQEDDKFFSLKTLQSGQDLNQVAEVNIDKMTDEQVFGAASDDEDDDDDLKENIDLGDVDEEAARTLKRELELDAAYDRYLQNTKNNAAKSGTKAAKRSKKQMREKLAQESHEDHEMLLLKPEQMDEDTRRYAEMLAGNDDSDSDGGSSDDDDGFHDAPVTPGEHARKKQKTGDASNPLIHKFADEPSSVKTARWFSNPLFASMGEVVNSATSDSKKDKEEVEDIDVVSESENDETKSKTATSKGKKASAEKAKKKGPAQREKQPKKEKTPKAGLDAEDILAMMPKTDKQKRHEKRMQAKERDERRQARRAKRLGESETDFDLVARDDDDDMDYDNSIDDIAGMTPAKKAKLLEARRLIKAGMGDMGDGDTKNTKFEVVGQGSASLPVMDDRKYDSENEDYDSDDYAKTMALGTMMLRKSKAKALVDASYNRYAWNDPANLPEWFVDNENRHYRPQLPIPEALLAKMKEKQLALSTRPIAKVAEARARKNRKAKLKLDAAKKKAAAVANSSEMSETMKLKSISKALRSNASGKGKEYIVAKKGGGTRGVKGQKVVDKRMKSDKRSMERATKKRKTGKKGGLTGGKKRRHHK